MKKIIASFALFFVLLGSGYSQDFRFGFQASPSFSSMNSNNNTINGNGTNLGMKLGLMGEKYFRDNYGFTFGVNFAFNHGGTLNYEGKGNYWPDVDLLVAFRDLPRKTNLVNHLQYLEIPVGFKMKTQEFGYFKFYADLPVITLGILTQAKGDISGENLLNSTEGEDIRKAINFMTLSWGLGGGTEYSIGENISLIGGIFFQSSFLDITKDKGTSYTEYDGEIEQQKQEEDSKGKMNVITIRLGIMF